MLNRALSHTICGVTISALVLVGCGGSGSRDRSKSGANDPTRSLSVVKGVVTQAAPNDTLTVAGRALNASDAVVTENGASGSRGSAGVGMTVAALVGADNTAQVIDVAIVVRGPIDSISTAANLFTVLGQTISYTATTVFNGTSAATLASGNVVSVSGSVATDGSFVATRVDFVSALYAAGTQLQVTGTVKNLATAAATFNLGTLVVNYAAAPALNPPLANGMNVAVGGTVLPVANVFAATELSSLTAPTSPGTPAATTVSGAITSVAVTGEFVVTGQKIRTSATTRYVNGTAADIKAGASVTVIGTIDTVDATLLNATDVTFAASAVAGEARIKAPVEAIDTASGTLTVLGIPVSVATTTLIASEDEPDDAPVTLADIQVGDVVEVNGAVSGTGVTATAIQLDDDDDPNEVKLTAPVATVGATDLTILGVTITTTSSTGAELRGSSESNLANFFATVQPGNVVEAEGTYADGVLTATELEIAGADDDTEDDD